MNQKLTKEDLEIIEDELNRYQSAYHRIEEEVLKKNVELRDNQILAREITSEIVASQRDEEKQALQNEESVAHGLAKLRLEQTNALGDLIEQPYFARVVYNETGKDVEFKLGLASFPELRIIDWRKAPISKLYYDYEEGEEYDDEIAGRDRQGQIVLKRAFRGRGKDLGSIDLKNCSYVQFHGEWKKQKRGQTKTFSMQDKEKIKELLAQDNLDKLQDMSQGNGYLHNVLSLLTPEQFQMISLEEDKPVIIQGSAGTGKTTVALHRLAWLMFEGNSQAKAENTLVIMFNRSLAAYVKHVLPELGIHNVKIATFFDWAEDIIETCLGEKIKYQTEDIPWRAAKFKAHHKTLELFQTFLSKQKDLKNPKQVLFQFFKDAETRKVLDRIKGGHQTQNYIDEQAANHRFDSYDLSFILHILFKDQNCYRARHHPVFLDYLIIDEAQDFTIGELHAVIQALEDKNCLTMAGDLGQKILENRDFGTWEELLDELHLSGIDVLNLNIAYRSTYQIYQLAEHVRNPRVKDEDLHLTPKFGPDPSLTQCHNFADAILETQKWLEEIQSNNRHTIGAIICKTKPEARSVFDALLRVGSHGVRYGDAQHFEFTPGITVTDIAQVKGLEFANVLLFNPSEENYSVKNIHHRNSLYVAITRAEYKVDMICYDHSSKLLPDFLRTTDHAALHQDLEDKPLFSDTDQDTSRFDEESDYQDEDVIIVTDSE